MNSANLWMWAEIVVFAAFVAIDLVGNAKILGCLQKRNPEPNFGIVINAPGVTRELEIQRIAMAMIERKGMIPHAALAAAEAYVDECQKRLDVLKKPEENAT